jgi:hypothetical protein
VGPGRLLHRHHPHHAPNNQQADRSLDGVDHLESMAGPLEVIGNALLVRRQPSTWPFQFEKANAAVGMEDLKIGPAAPRTHS